MENNWEYEISGGILTLKVNLLAPPTGLTGSKRGSRVKLACTGNLSIVAEGVPVEANAQVNLNVTREGTLDELRELGARRRAVAEALGYTPIPPPDTY